jgi:hypothetical protein
MTSNEQRILVIGERQAQLNPRALADLLAAGSGPVSRMGIGVW